MKTDELKLTREAINQIDAKIASLVEKRSELSKEVAKIKAKNSLPVYYAEREHAILEKISKHSALGEGLRPIFTEIVSLCRKKQKLLAISVPKERYYPSLVAAKIIFGSAVDIVPSEKINLREADYYLCPLEKNMDESLFDFLLGESFIKNAVVYYIESLKKSYLLISSSIDSDAFTEELHLVCFSKPVELKDGVFLSQTREKAFFLRDFPKNLPIRSLKTLRSYYASY